MKIALKYGVKADNIIKDIEDRVNPVLIPYKMNLNISESKVAIENSTFSTMEGTT